MREKELIERYKQNMSNLMAFVMEWGSAQQNNKTVGRRTQPRVAETYVTQRKDPQEQRQQYHIGEFKGALLRYIGDIYYACEGEDGNGKIPLYHCHSLI